MSTAIALLSFFFDTALFSYGVHFVFASQIQFLPRKRSFRMDIINRQGAMLVNLVLSQTISGIQEKPSNIKSSSFQNCSSLLVYFYQSSLPSSTCQRTQTISRRLVQSNGNAPTAHTSSSWAVSRINHIVMVATLDTSLRLYTITIRNNGSITRKIQGLRQDNNAGVRTNSFKVWWKVRC